MPVPVPAPTIQTASDYLALAKTYLEPAVWAYLTDGDSQSNERALNECQLMPRPLRDVRGGHTRLTLFGQQLEHPILLAPIAYQRLFHPDGETASAMAASAQGSQMLISSLASQPIQSIVEAATSDNRNRPWFQLYWQDNRAQTLQLLQRALAAGCTAVVLTIDAPIKRATLQLPNNITAINLQKSPQPITCGSAVFDGWMARAPTWNDLIWLRQQTPLPLLIKGLLHPDDAESAITAGCDGIIVSNHGNRILHGTPASLTVLPGIVKQVANRIPILFDSGIRTGRDIFVALACGATATLLGRPYIWGLTANGAMGVAHVIRLLRDELEMTMALTGCAQLADIGPHCLYTQSQPTPNSSSE